MNIVVSQMEKEDIAQFKIDIQEAFQKGFEEVYGESEGQILPEKDIDQSLNAQGSVAYKAVIDGEMVGGAVVVIDESTQHNHLHLLYVKHGVQTKGIGYTLWSEIEKLHPETKIWETCTPYFERRNIHFYVNKCKFHIVEFQREFEDEGDESFIGDGGEGMFIFHKYMH